MKQTLSMRGAIALAASLLPTPVQGKDRLDFAAERVIMIADIHAKILREAPEANDSYFLRTLAAMSEIPREKFVSDELADQAYREKPLPIGYDQTISDPYIVAVMIAAAHIPQHANVLDIGTGSGYQAAVLARLADKVSSIEIVRPLAEQAAGRLAKLGYGNIQVRAGDGYAGWVEHGPFDAVIVAAGAAEAPQPLLDQLKPGGRLVMPIGPSWAQEQIQVLTRSADGTITRCTLGWALFVPLTGRGMRSPRHGGPFDATIPPCYERPIAGSDIATPPSKQAVASYFTILPFSDRTISPLFCELFGHWPVPLGTRRRHGRWVNRCWLCDHGIVRDAGLWRFDDEAPPA